MGRNWNLQPVMSEPSLKWILLPQLSLRKSGCHPDWGPWETPNQNIQAKSLLNSWSWILWDNGCLLLRGLLSLKFWGVGYAAIIKSTAFGTRKWDANISNALKYWNGSRTEYRTDVGSSLRRMLVKAKTVNSGSLMVFKKTVDKGLKESEANAIGKCSITVDN